MTILIFRWWCSKQENVRLTLSLCSIQPIEVESLRFRVQGKKKEVEGK
ncbi:unnamed protein product [Paramecium sonneborni]|uniref:Uncharacterized protein n=1 Tax=Paramecium sonneborni TaxID=65129 RepID=A0A8S1PJS6_9CILI|nr:unnamed protein product [Paramecium sonneborni]